MASNFAMQLPSPRRSIDRTERSAFSMRTGGTAPRPRFRETCEISVATSVYRLSGIYAVSGKPSSRFVFKKLFYIMIFQRLELESIDRLD